MITVGVSRVHNASVCLFIDDKLIFHIENERLSNIKYDRYPFLALQKIKDYVDHIDNLVIAGVGPMNSVEPFDDKDVYTAMILNLGRTFNDHGFTTYDLCQQHHVTHAACAFYNSQFESALCIIKDGMGSDVDIQGENFVEGTKGRENGSSFLASYPNNFELIDKHICVNFDLPYAPYYINETTYLSNTLSEALAFQKTAKSFGFHELDAGKVMGMAAYKEGYAYDIYDQEFISKKIFKFMKNDLREGRLLNNFTNFDEKCLFSNNLQEQIQTKVLEYIKKMLDNTSEKNLCLSGGFFLNCVANNFIKDRLPSDVNLYVEPISSDAGTSIGAAKLIINSLKKEKTQVSRDLSLYLGPSYQYSKDYISNLCSNNDIQSCTSEVVAKLLQNRKIVAIYQGRSEAGPRALGNRSILYDPTDSNGKDKINSIKKREFFRPFAGTVILEHCKDWFELGSLTESPHMMFALPIKDNRLQQLSAITHIDNTCRVQTLKLSQNKYFYEILNEFYKMTGVPVLLNTSFNLAGDTIVETIEDALYTLNNSEIDYLYLPETNQIIS